MQSTNKQNYAANVLVVAASILVGMVLPVSATTVSISQTNITVYSAGSTAVSGNVGAKVGYFVNSFVPTLANITSWDENFRSFNGYYQGGNKKFLISGSFGDGNVGGGTQTGATYFGVATPAGTQLYLMGSTSAYASANNTNSTTNADYIGATSSTPVFILADTSWIMPTTTSLDTSTITFGFTANTGLAVFGGTTMGSSFSYNASTGVGSLTMITAPAIPEPTSGSLLLLGLASFLAIRARKLGGNR